MQADHSATPVGVSSLRGAPQIVNTTEPPLDLGGLATPQMRIDAAALINLLRSPTYQPRDQVVEVLSGLRRDLLALVDGYTRLGGGFGIGVRPADPLDITGLEQLTRTSLERLESLYEAGAEATLLSYNQREIILQAGTVLREFLITLSDLTNDGTVNRSDTSGLLRQCVGLGQIVGQMALSLEPVKGV